MPLVLGIVGSARRNGNSEIMARIALEGAAASGAETEILRLSDFNIRPCTGCMTCIFKDQDCPQKDDAQFVLNKMISADGVVFAAPVYFLWPTGWAKMLIDRMFLLEHLAPNRPQKPAAVIVTLGYEHGWLAFSVPLLASSLLFAGFWVTDALVASAQGPGEVLLKPDLVERAREIGHSLLSSEKQYPVEGTRCPICLGQAFELHAGGRVQCPICWVKGQVIGQQGDKALIRFNADWPSNNRFTPESMYDHLNNKIKGSKQMFAARRDAIREARMALNNRPVNWVKPPQ